MALLRHQQDEHWLKLRTMNSLKMLGLCVGSKGERHLAGISDLGHFAESVAAIGHMRTHVLI